MRTIAVMNQKGGTGKTTTAVNLAACLAEKSQRVLIVDLDAQANATTHYGVADGSKGVFEVFVNNGNLVDLVCPTGVPGVDLVPASPWLAHAEKVLAGEVGAELVLRKALEALPVNRWDIVLLDCPPSLAVISVAALAAVREVLVPVETQTMAMSGLAALVQTIDKVKQRLNPDITLGAILACRARTSTSLSREVVERLRDKFGSLVLDTVIRENTRLAEAYGFGKPITAYDPRSAGAEDYRAAAREFLARS